MSDESPVSLSRGLPETVLAPLPDEWVEQLDFALDRPQTERRDALGRVAGEHPQMLAAWAALAEQTTDPVESYAFARVGYHRGLDALRAAGWRGTGYVRFREATNRGFLRSLEALRAAAGSIGEFEEEERCRLFLYQLDPDWSRSIRP